MIRWIGTTLSSSVGKKAVLGLTGLLLIGFLVEHLVGNLNLYLDSDGQAFNDYVEGLQSFGALLTVAEIGLALLFVCHIVIAIRITMENREARSQRYEVRGDRGAKTPASASMFITGALLLAYIIKHLLDFRFGGFLEAEDPAAEVAARLTQIPHALVYVAGSIVVGVHLSHGMRSAFQSIGVSHPRLNPLLERAGIALAVLVALGFASFPVYYMFFYGGGVN